MYNKLRWLIFSSGLVLISGCSVKPENKNLDRWLGNYGYNEPPVKAFAGYNMVMLWDISVNKIEEMYTAILNVDGQQTSFSLLNNITGNDTTLLSYTINYFRE